MASALSSLERIGLSRQEAGLYLAVLKLGSARASEIAQKAGIKREAAYYTLNLLREKGYVGEVIKSGIKHYTAVPPERILEIIEAEQLQKMEAVRDALPDLKGLQRSALARPKVEVYEGVEGFKTIAAKLLEREDTAICAILSESILRFLPHFHPQFRRKRVERNVRIRTITERTPLLEEIRRRDRKELRETRFADRLLRGTDVLYYILDDAVILIKANEREQVGVYIEERSFAEMQRRIFEQLWKDAKKA